MSEFCLGTAKMCIAWSSVQGQIRAIVMGVALVVVGQLGAQTVRPSEKEAVSLLKQKCFQCHSDTVQMSNLNLQTREAMLKGGDRGPAIVPGDAEASRLYRRVAGLEQPRMPMAPMPELTPQEIA